MNTEVSKDYKTIRRVGIWSTVLLWYQVISLPVVVLWPYILNKNTVTPITIKQFLAIGVVNVVFYVTVIILLIVKGEVLKHPENIPVGQIKRNTKWLIWTLLACIIIQLFIMGFYGTNKGLTTNLFLLLVVILAVIANRVAKKHEMVGSEYIKQ